jgi:hypothetical protein
MGLNTTVTAHCHCRPWYAALNPRTGEVIGQTASRHTSKEFVAFLSEAVATPPADREIHIILDNLSAHKTPLVTDFLHQHCNVKLHSTPHLLFVAEPSRNLVLQGGARRYHSRDLHFGSRSPT